MHISPKIDFGTYKPIIVENIHYFTQNRFIYIKPPILMNYSNKIEERGDNMSYDETKICPVCGNEVSGDFRFCSNGG